MHTVEAKDAVRGHRIVGKRAVHHRPADGTSVIGGPSGPIQIPVEQPEPEPAATAHEAVCRPVLLVEDAGGIGAARKVVYVAVEKRTLPERPVSRVATDQTREIGASAAVFTMARRSPKPIALAVVTEDAVHRLALAERPAAVDRHVAGEGTVRAEPLVHGAAISPCIVVRERGVDNGYAGICTHRATDSVRDHHVVEEHAPAHGPRRIEEIASAAVCDRVYAVGNERAVLVDAVDNGSAVVSLRPVADKRTVGDRVRLGGGDTVDRPSAVCGRCVCHGRDTVAGKRAVSDLRTVLRRYVDGATGVRRHVPDECTVDDLHGR